MCELYIFLEGKYVTMYVQNQGMYVQNQAFFLKKSIVLRILNIRIMFLNTIYSILRRNETDPVIFILGNLEHLKPKIVQILGRINKILITQVVRKGNQHFPLIKWV